MLKKSCSLLLSGVLLAGAFSTSVWGEDTSYAGMDIINQEEEPASPSEDYSSGELLSGNSISGELLSGNSISEELLSGDPNSEELFSEDPISEDSISGELISEETLPAEILPEEVEKPESRYVIIPENVPVYADPLQETPEGWFTADTVVCGEHVLIEELPDQDWMCVLFDAETFFRGAADVSDSESAQYPVSVTDSEEITFRFVRTEDVIFLSEAEEADCIDALSSDPYARLYGDILIPAVSDYEYCDYGYDYQYDYDSDSEDEHTDESTPEIAGSGVKRISPVPERDTDASSEKNSRETLQDKPSGQTQAKEIIAAGSTTALRIVTQPSDLKTDVGGAVSFSVRASGKGLAYQWQWQAKDGTDWFDTALTGARTNTLSITNTPSGFDGRKYRCVITDSAGSTLASDAAALTVGGAEIISQPSGMEIDAGGEVSFSVQAEGSGLTYQWQWQAPGSSVWQNTSLTGARTDTLRISDVPAGFNGRSYRCVVGDTSPKKAESAPALLTVINVAFTEQPKNVSATTGGNAVFHAAASGSNLSWQWQWMPKGGSTWSNTSIAGAKTDTLQISGTPAAFDGRKYRCVVTNAYGKKAESRAVELTVSGVRISMQPANVTIDLGGTAVFRTAAEGNGLTYQWQWQAPGSSSWSSTSMTGANTSALTVKDPPAVFNGRKYRCVIKDNKGKQAVTGAAALTVINVAVTVQPKNTTADALSSPSISISASGTGLTYQWEWQAKGGSLWQNTSLAGSTTKTLQLKEVPLSFNGRKYRCVVKNINGKTAESNAAVLTVKDTGSAGFFKWIGEDDAVKILLQAPYAKYTSLGAGGDATQISLMGKSIDYVQECNELRARENSFRKNEPDWTPLEPLMISPILMAMAESNVNAMKEIGFGHLMQFYTAENIAWGYADPFSGWYWDEREAYIHNTGGAVGHYLNIINNEYEMTGFSMLNSLCSQTFDWGDTYVESLYDPTTDSFTYNETSYGTHTYMGSTGEEEPLHCKGYTVSEFRSLYNAYMKKLYP